MMFLLGKQAMFGHDPPMYLRSITATRCPLPAKVHAAIVDPVPPPKITRSNSSGSLFLLGNPAVETFPKLFMSLFLSRRRAQH
jgi:hypothetical protein